MAKIRLEGSTKIEGIAHLDINTIRCVCGYCGNNDNENAYIEFNFLEQRVIYVCSQCKKENHMVFGKDKPQPYPSIRVSR